MPLTITGKVICDWCYKIMREDESFPFVIRDSPKLAIILGREGGHDTKQIIVCCWDCDKQTPVLNRLEEMNLIVKAAYIEGIS